MKLPLTLRPMLAALDRHRTPVALIVLEIALTFAVISNAIALIAHRYAWLQLDSGVPDRQLLYIRTDGVNKDAGPLYATMLARLRSLPGVQSAAQINSVPFSPRTGTAGFYLDASQRHFGRVSDFYFGTPGYLRILGVRIIAGRGFAASDYRPFDLLPASGGMLISQPLAALLWPGQNPLGKTIWLGKRIHYQIIGVTAPVLRPHPQYEGLDNAYDSLFLPAAPSVGLGGNFVLRVAPARQAEVLRAAEAAIHGVDRGLVINRWASGSITQLRAAYFKREKIMIGLLAGVVLALMLVTGLGIMGLSGFWVQQRTRQIGMRRALGATRGDILRYFQTENFLLATAGIVLGCAAAIGINVWLMAHYAVPRLPVMYLPIGALALWLLGQLAVLGPALRAARVPPTVAMRSA